MTAQEQDIFDDSDIEIIEVGDEIFQEISALESDSQVSRMDTIYDSQRKISSHNQMKQELIMDALTQNIFEYTIMPGDTLMLIAYKTLGDYRLWRYLEDWNPSIQGQSESLTPGLVLKYDISYKVDQLSPKGEPYLILKNDTLGKISHKVYEDKGRHWRFIYENNKNLIYDPHVIFAGFTLYYLPLESNDSDREPAQL